MSESKLVKMPHCWKSHVAAHISLITQSLEEIHSGRETGLIDTGPLPCLTSQPILGILVTITDCIYFEPCCFHPFINIHIRNRYAVY